ncbi:hypothetical protein D9757_005478 [Collybiopsis confluens]|uniref:Pheromone receptor n=1 Tax=Collybiopsis confluens TaxID=2823264 RepID=A0A8H5HLT7_9AGAR|nr:hypothetical protein D9757_005478 [Collybiopsis confluens]
MIPIASRSKACVSVEDNQLAPPSQLHRAIDININTTRRKPHGTVSWEVAEVMGICQAGYIMPCAYQGSTRLVVDSLPEDIRHQSTADEGSRFDPAKAIGQGISKNSYSAGFSSYIAALEDVFPRHKFHTRPCEAPSPRISLLTMAINYDAQSLTYPNWVFSMCAFIGFLLSVIPLPWHLEAWNTGTCLYMMWTGLACLNQFINSIIWTGNVINWAPVWCDISTRFMIGSAVAIPAASLCINRRLYYIATANAVTITQADRRRAVLVDLCIGVGIPVLQMILQYIDQGHRFNLFEDIGCFPFTYNTWVAKYSNSAPLHEEGTKKKGALVLSIRAFNKRRAQFKELLSSNSNLNSNRYFRLMCLAATEILFTIPLSCWSIYLNVTSEAIQPWKGWADTHSDFSRVGQYPSVIWHLNSGTAISLETSRWFVVLCSVVFFGYFGFADEARKNYRAAIGSFARRVGLSTSNGSFGSSLWSTTGSKASTAQNGSIPVFVHKRASRRRDSLDSFTDFGASFKEKSFGGQTSYGAMSLVDAGGALPDLEPSPTDTIAPSIPSPVKIRGAEKDSGIEMVTVRRLSDISMPASPVTSDGRDTEAFIRRGLDA